MPQETLGYVKLEWTCPKCATRNPGTEKTCVSCGAPQPAELQFEQAQGQQISQDETLKKIAEAGPDIHCAFCGARNPAGSAVCSQCGADLKEGKRREAGKVMGAYQAGPVEQIACANCGTMNPETAIKCAGCGGPLGSSRPAVAPAAQPAVGGMPAWIWMAVAALALICLVGGIGWMMSRSMARNDLTGQVAVMDWQTYVDIEALQAVNYSDWEDQIPEAAQIGTCDEQVRFVQDEEPAQGEYNKVCGTPYTVDTGAGVGKVVQDCQFEVLAQYCEYTVEEWRVVRQAEERGADRSPFFAEPQLEQGQRLGEREARFVIIFDTPDGRYEYTVDSPDEFEQFEVGSEWVLTVNGFNQIVGVEPAE